MEVTLVPSPACRACGRTPPVRNSRSVSLFVLLHPYMHACCTLSWRKTIPDDNTPLLLFCVPLRKCVRVSLYIAAVIVVPRSINSTSKMALQSQNVVAISFLLGNACKNFFGLLAELVYIHCFNCFFILVFINCTHTSPPLTIFLGKFSPSLL